jgi:hypothetical protein
MQWRMLTDVTTPKCGTKPNRSAKHAFVRMRVCLCAVGAMRGGA